MSSPMQALHAGHGSKGESSSAPSKSKRPQAVGQQVGTAIHRLFYHMYTIYLFTESDIPTTWVQMQIFSASGAASGLLTGGGATPGVALLRNLPWAFVFTWLLLLVVQLGNQTVTGAPEEDALNKPWRPVPSGRISREHAHALRVPAAAIAMLLAWSCGAQAEAAIFTVLVYVYNDFGASDTLVIRNLWNGTALAVVACGTLRCAAYPAPVTDAGYYWCATVAAFIAMTIQTQDFRDQEGDGARGRETLPLVLGDAPARWLTVAPVLVWSLLCPWWCGAGLLGYGLSLVTGLHTVHNLLAYRTRLDDRKTYRLWSRWQGVIFAMPLMSLLP